MGRVSIHVRKRRRGAAWAGIVLLLAAVAAVGILFLLPYARAEMDMTLLDTAERRTPSVLYAYDTADRVSRKGKLHPAPNAALPDDRQSYTPYDQIPEDLVNAFVAIEDKRFWRHGGVDILRTVRAGAGYLTGRSRFGGSTITQQLVKNLTGDDRHTPERKLTEIFRAMDLEKKASKTKILEAYLNVINLAEGCFGVGAASERYFSKPVSELTLDECAVIAAITNNPTRYDPLTHPEENRKRRDLILREMASQGYITEAERDEAAAREIRLTPTPLPESVSPTSWYADLVVADVIRDLRERLGYGYAAASALVYGGGLTIETAMDEELQRVVETYYADVSHFPVGEQGRPQSSFILMDPHTGDILAVAGAVGEKCGNRLQNYATDTRRPSGSCIKPLTVYAPALEQGRITWASLYEDEPLALMNGRAWPANGDGKYRGTVTVGRAVAESLNPVAVRILREVGEKNAFTFARDRLGMDSLIPAAGGAANDETTASLALGQQSRGVTVRELTAAYTAFTDGIYRRPVSYHRVLDETGRVLLENKPAGEAERALSPANAALMTRLLGEVTRRGTAARYLTITQDPGIQAAGKTGTTQNTCDRWFVGYTPRLLAGVWMGYDYPSELKGIQGNPCVTLWDDLMKRCEAVYEGSAPRSDFPLPDGLISVRFCPLSGERLNEYCEDPVEGMPGEEGWFIRGSEPRGICGVHTEPPIRLIPADPGDPERIPLLPNDLLPEADTPQSRGPASRSSRWRLFPRGRFIGRGSGEA
ncbi:MAG: hypothetical protein E7610_08030 [Ruminococcaceae bacterium]|nr:hypothetical protein [Oscillospiraceae bacterium]